MGSVAPPKAEALMTAFKLRDLDLPNRMVLAPMTRGRATAAHVPTPMMADYYAARAAGGLLISEGTFISPAAIGWANAPEIYSDAAVAAWTDVTAAVHAAGGRIFCQLWHTGRASHSAFREDGSLGVAPSAVAIRDGSVHLPDGSKAPYEVPHAMSVAEIQATVGDYAKAATNAMAAGFDGVEIHSANGYLLDEFLQTHTNQRTDAYGAGSLEGRFRFLKEVVTAVTSAVPAHRVGVRFSPNGVFNDMGTPDFRAAYTYFAGQLDAFGLAYLHVMDGLAFGFHKLGEPMALPEFRAVFSGPLMGNCGYTLAGGEAAVAAGAADLIAFGRPWIANPDLPRRFADGLPLNADEGGMATWYTHDAEGYTTYPTAAEAADAKTEPTVERAEGDATAAKVL